MTHFDRIQKPTLVLNPTRVRRNIQRMADKARSAGVRFRPHFKTHQSAVIGEWFRPAGVTAITASSVDMALYFARNGWKDITIAFPVNWRQIESLHELAKSIHLGLLAESVETVEYLGSRLHAPADLWIKVDVGANRTGLDWDRPEEFIPVLRAAQKTGLRLKGLLTHAGHTYKSATPADVIQTYQESTQRVHSVRQYLEKEGFGPLEVTVGDTPGCTLSPDLGSVDEIRPGNFVFYDSTQLHLGTCKEKDIAVAVACPVVARHPEREEVVVYGGAIHLSVDRLSDQGRTIFGFVAQPDSNDGWGQLIPGAYTARLSQEHGVIHLPSSVLEKVRVGDLLFVIPAHSCLTVTALGEYLTLDGEIIPVGR